MNGNVQWPYRTAVLTSFLSVLFESTVQHPSVFISGALGMILSPYAAFQQRKITEVEALQKINESLEEEVTHLQAENTKLTDQVKQVEGSVSNLAALEATMEAVNALQGDSIGKLQEQLQESKDILASMDRNCQGFILQNLVTVLLATDADQNMMLSDEEIDELIHNLEGIQGVQLKEDLLRKTIIEQGRSVGAVMEVARNVLTPPDNSSTVDPMFSYLE